MEKFICWLNDFPWGVFLGCFIPLLLLWWFLSRKISYWKNISYEQEERIEFLEGELEACRKSKISTTSNSNEVAEIVSKPESSSSNPPAEVIATPIPIPMVGSKVKKDDLKIVEGIGPKIEGLFNEAGIYTFADLAATSVSRMKEILEAAGPRFQIHNPSTWADQAALARDGKWDELKKWQSELYKGKA